MIVRLALAVLALALAGSAAFERLYSTNPAILAGQSALTPDRDRTLLLARQALNREVASPYRWADLAEALYAAGQTPQSLQAFDRALALAPYTPQIWLRHANFCFLRNEPVPTLRSAARVLATVPDFDAILFYDLDQLDLPAADVVESLSQSPRALRSWLSHVIAIDRPVAARLAWKRIASQGVAQAPLTHAYTSYLLQKQAWYDAIAAWSEWLGARRGDYPNRNYVFNGNFASDPSGSSLDWHIQSSPEDADFFQTTRESGVIHVHFAGKTNVNYDNLSQIVVLPLAGHYRLSARYKSDDITTNEGPRLAITDLGLETDPIVGAHDWTPLSLEFAISKPRAVRVAIIRRPSRKFDNKIQGNLYLTDVVLR